MKKLHLETVNTMMLTFVLALFTILMGGYNALDYCDRTLCPEGGIHIQCKNPGIDAAACAENYLILDRNLSVLQNLVLHLHNECRNLLASGKSGLYKAARMPLLKWNEELAKFAQSNVERCVTKHDDCRNSLEFPLVGQNIGFIHHMPNSNKFNTDVKVEEIRLSEIINSWCSQGDDFPQAWIDKFPAKTNDRFIAQFSNMIQDHTTDIGCSAIYYKKHEGFLNNGATILLVCNYSYRNMINYPVYAKGPSASQCKTGTDKQYPALCSSKETFSFDFKKYKCFNFKKQDTVRRSGGALHHNKYRQSYRHQNFYKALSP